jgi:hypothetical protein
MSYTKIKTTPAWLQEIVDNLPLDQWITGGHVPAWDWINDLRLAVKRRVNDYSIYVDSHDYVWLRHEVAGYWEEICRFGRTARGKYQAVLDHKEEPLLAEMEKTLVAKFRELMK